MNEIQTKITELVDIRTMFKEFTEKERLKRLNYDKIKIMVYPSIESITTKMLVKVEVVIKDIQQATDRQNVKKEELPVAYFSAADIDGRKENQNVTKHSGLIVIDIDKKDNPDLDFQQFKEELINYKYTYACFTSPSGGIKLIINTNISNVEHHLPYFRMIKRHLLNTYPQLAKIDNSGCNVARACYLPYDGHAYINTNAKRLCLDEDKIAETLKQSGYEKHVNRRPLTKLDSISFDEHYDNILNLLKNRTTVGLQGEVDFYAKTSAGINNEIITDNRTTVGLQSEVDSENGTSVGLQGVVDFSGSSVVINNNFNYGNRTSVGLTSELHSENRTSVGLYDNIFNKYRYSGIDKRVMRTDVPFLELLVLKNMYPYRLDYTTNIDEHYFNDPQKQIHANSIGLDGLEVCEVVLPKHHIKEHYRAKTLGSISMKLIFNNPFCHPDIILKELLRINDCYCEDPHPHNNPKPDDEEVTNLFLHNYRLFINGELDFSGVIRRNYKTKAISKKYVFRSKQYDSTDKHRTQQEAIRTFTQGKRESNVRSYLEAIKSLQNGKRITKKRIADYMGVSTRNLRRISTEELEVLIKKYNSALKIQLR